MSHLIGEDWRASQDWMGPCGCHQVTCESCYNDGWRPAPDPPGLWWRRLVWHARLWWHRNDPHPTEPRPEARQFLR